MNFADELNRSFRKFLDLPAITEDLQTLSYGELDNRSLAIAAHLSDLGLRNSCIAVATEYAAEHLTCIVGILRSGNYYFSITEENYTFLSACSLPVSAVLCTGHWLENQLPGRKINFRDIGASKEMDKRVPEVDISSETRLCAFLTSGSTSTPKVVIHSHGTIWTDTMRQIDENEISSADKVDLVFSLSFSASLACIFPAFVAGAELCLFDLRKNGQSKLVKFWRSKHITFSTLAVSTFQSLCQTQTNFKDLALRFISISAEPLKDDTLSLFSKNFRDNVVLQVAYATTETRTISEFRLTPSSATTFSSDLLGNITRNKQVHITSDNDAHVPAGTTGEIIVESFYIAREYYNNPEETKRHFQKMGDKSIFRTGDLGYLDEKGQLHYVGRKMQEDKINGIKINIRLVEEHLERILGCRCAVLIRDIDRQKRLVAFTESQNDTDLEVVRQKLLAILPLSHLPSALFNLTPWPCTHSGKTNRQFIANYQIQDYDGCIGPEATLEHLEEERRAIEIAEIYRRVLERKSVKPDDDFFSLGGDSLTALHAASEIESLMGAPISSVVLYTHRTPGQLAEYLKHHDSKLVSKIEINHFVPGRKTIYILAWAKTGSFEEFIPTVLSRFNICLLVYDVIRAGSHPYEVDNILKELRLNIDQKDCLVMGTSFNGYLAHHLASLLPNISYCILIDTYNYYDYRKYQRSRIELICSVFRYTYKTGDWRYLRKISSNLFKKIIRRVTGPSNPEAVGNLAFIKTINSFLDKLGHSSSLKNCIYFRSARTGIKNQDHGHSWAGYTNGKFRLFEHICDHDILKTNYELVSEQILETLETDGYFSES